MGRDAIAQALTDYLTAHQPGVVVAYLFGSVARGTDRPTSDIDLAVLLARDPAPSLDGLPFDLAADLQERLGRVVDVVVLNGAPVDLVHRVLSEGRVLIDRDRSARIAFEVRGRRDYFDLLPVLERYRRRVEVGR